MIRPLVILGVWKPGPSTPKEKTKVMQVPTLCNLLMQVPSLCNKICATKMQLSAQFFFKSLTLWERSRIYNASKAVQNHQQLSVLGFRSLESNVEASTKEVSFACCIFHVFFLLFFCATKMQLCASCISGYLHHFRFFLWSGEAWFFLVHASLLFFSPEGAWIKIMSVSSSMTGRCYFLNPW